MTFSTAAYLKKIRLSRNGLLLFFGCLCCFLITAGIGSLIHIILLNWLEQGAQRTVNADLLLLIKQSAIFISYGPVFVIGAVAQYVLVLLLFCRPMRKLGEVCVKRLGKSDLAEKSPALFCGGEFQLMMDLMAEHAEESKSVLETADSMRNEAFKESRKAARAVRKADKAAKRAACARREALDHAADKLGHEVAGLKTSSEDVKRNISQVNEGTREQKRDLSGAVVAMNQMHVSISDVSKNSSEAEDVSDKARRIAERGATIVAKSAQSIQRMVDVYGELETSMEELKNNSVSIEKIISVISDIADQTNLLALNAAIEAARAGDSGRGFAVVADEVRKLAEKTMAATDDVEGGISAIRDVAQHNIVRMRDVDSAMADVKKHAKESGISLNKIVSFTDTTATRIQSIAEAARCQAEASSDMLRKMESIGVVAEKNAGDTELCRAELESMVGKAQEVLLVVKSLKNEAAGEEG